MNSDWKKNLYLKRHNRSNTSPCPVIDQEAKERLIFDYLSKFDQNILISNLVSTVQNSGLLLTDPRLCFLESLLKRPLTDELCFSDFQSLLRLDSQNLIEKCCTGALTISNFPNFCKDIKRIFDVSQEVLDQTEECLDDDIYALAICSLDGQRYNIGESSKQCFPMEGICKILLYCMALEEHGEDVVHEYIAHEPSGLSLHENSLLEKQGKKKRPHNPLMTTGAIVCSSLILRDISLTERMTKVLDVLDKLTTEKSNFPRDANLQERLSSNCFERTNASLNFSLGYMLQHAHCFPASTELHQVIEFFLQSSSINTTVEELAIFAATLASGGISPLTLDRVFEAETVHYCLSMMYSCGMGKQSGFWSFNFGVPAMQTVNGVLIVVIPGILGICLRDNPTNIRGICFFQMLVNEYRFHNYDNIPGTSYPKSMSFIYFPNSSFPFRSSGKKEPRKELTLMQERLIRKLLFAAAEGDVCELRRLNSSGIDLNVADYDKRTALHLAAAEGKVYAVRYLLRHHAKVNVKDRWGGTPLSDALKFGHGCVAKLLVLADKEATSNSSNQQEYPFQSDQADQLNININQCTTLQSNPSFSDGEDDFCIDQDEFDISSHSANQYISIAGDNMKAEGLFSIKQLFETLNDNGLQDNDPRLKHMIDNAKMLGSDALVSSEQYRHITESGAILLEKAIHGTLVIPNFRDFCDDIFDIYMETKGIQDGNIADYIPQLAAVDPNKYAISLCSIDGQRFSVGDSDEEFCVQSCSKPISYCIALEELDENQVHEHMGYEPSGLSFNELNLMDINGKRLPHNPMINAGAIMSSGLMYPNLPMYKRFDKVMHIWSDLCGKSKVCFDNSVYLSEKATADRNFCLGYMMKEAKCFPEGTVLQETLDFYFQQCSLAVTCEQFSILAATLANGGVCPVTNQRIFSSKTVRNCLSLMYSCGMYDYSGEWSFRIGLPAKSGVSGAIIVVIPNVMGICTWSPRLDAMGNSCRGIAFCKALADKFSFHNLDQSIPCMKKLKVNPVHRESIQMEKADIQFHAFYAVLDGNLEELNRIKLLGADLSLADYDGRTALHLAASEGHLHVVQFLLNSNVPKAPIDRWGGTPLYYAKMGKYEEIVKLIESN